MSGLLLPLFFAMSGLKTNILAITGAMTWISLIIVIVLACAGKVAGTLLVALYYQMPFYEGVTLGLLMNTKGLVEMIVLNVGKDQKVCSFFLYILSKRETIDRKFSKLTLRMQCY